MIFETIQTFLLIVSSWALFSATVSNDLFSCGFQGGPKQDTFKFADKCVIFSGKKGFNSGLFFKVLYHSSRFEFSRKRCEDQLN